MIAISQPTYLPWIGYFSLIDASEHFVFLNDVQFDSRSWQQRNRISINDNINYLTLPVIKKGLREQKINETNIVNNEVFAKHLLKIKHTYKKTRFFDEYFPKIENILSECKGLKNLSEINIFVIEEISKILDLKCNFIKSSDLNCSGKKSLKLINICKKLEKNDYIINEGAINYIKEDINSFKKNNIELYIIKYNEIPYLQLNKFFVEKLSIIDVLFNNGPQTIDAVKKNYKLTSYQGV